MSAETATKVLDHSQIQDRIRRIAWQIYEIHAEEEEIILAGIVESGYLFAKLLANDLSEISPLKVNLHRIVVDKRHPLSVSPQIQPEDTELHGKCVVVVDDVLNTGSTLIYGVKYFLDYQVKQIKTVVLVDRNHKSFPVKADFKGLSLSTNLMEHVEVKIDEEPYSVVVS